MPVYRICKRFTVESGHMLSKHPGACRFPHGHTRTIEVVVRSRELDANDMVLDFKALKLALAEYIERYDHAMAIHAADPLRPEMERVHPDSLVVFEDADPTTEVLARDIFDYAACILREGFRAESGGIVFAIEPGRVELERVRVWETPSSWAEYGE